MSKLDDILNDPSYEKEGGSTRDDKKREIKKLILDLYKESEYDGWEFIDMVSKL